MPYSRYDRRDNRRPEANISPWENGFPQTTQQPPLDQLSLAGNLLGQLLGRPGAVGIGTNLAPALVLPQATGLSQSRSGVLPMSGSSAPFGTASPFGPDSHRGRDYNSRSGRVSPRPRPRRSRSRSRSRDTSRRSDRDDRKHYSSSHRRTRSPERSTNEVYVGNYPGRFEEKDVRKLFEELDIKIVNIRMKCDGQKVFSFVETESREAVDKAVKALDSKEISGRRLRVRSAKDRVSESAPRPEPRRPIEPTEASSRRHLAYAIVEFLRRLTRREDVGEVDLAELKTAKESIKKAFNLPSDDSLKVSRRLEMVFMENNRRDIARYLEDQEAKAESAKNAAKKPASVNDNGVGDGVVEADEEKATFEEDDSGNWKRRKVAKDDDDEEDEPAAKVLKTEEETETKAEDEEEPKSEAIADNHNADADGDGDNDADLDADFNDVKVVGVFEEEEEDVLEIATTKQEIDFESESKDEENKETGDDGDEVEESGTPSKPGRGRGRGGTGRARRSRGRRP